MKGFVERGGLWVAGQLVLLLCVALLALRYPGTGSVFWSCAGTLGIVLAAVLAAAGVKELGRNLTPFPTPSDKGHLVQHGIYARIRHPLYTSVILAGFGWALAWLSWPSALAVVALIPFFHAKSRREEKLLRLRFPEYREYETHTHRFLPWIY
ncbi:MAG: methyltransferase family protein [Terrimicrobiaceae bacterium]